MTETESPKINPAAWMVMLLAVLLWELTLIGFGYKTSPGAGYLPVFGVFCVPAMIFGSMFLVPLLFAWMLAVMGVFHLAKCRRGLLRAGFMLLPVLIAVVGLAVSLVRSPPSPFTFFFDKMREKLPEDAHDFRVRGSFLVDSGDVFFYFRTHDAEGVRKLAERLRLVDVKLSDWEAAKKPDFLVYPANYRLGGSPDPLTWAGRHQFYRRDPSGTGVFLITNSSMTEVYFAQDTMYDRSDAEMAERERGVKPRVFPQPSRNPDTEILPGTKILNGGR